MGTVQLEVDIELPHETGFVDDIAVQCDGELGAKVGQGRTERDDSATSIPPENFTRWGFARSEARLRISWINVSAAAFLGGRELGSALSGNQRVDWDFLVVLMDFKLESLFQ